ncbi:MAG: hemerythrin domain-containing protein [Sneathiella sp.]|nr:hemerythrin domain-containing protein [Sneathiella sp.]
MLDTFNIRTEDMPSKMRSLLGQYPRDSWEAHPGFKEKTRHWLDAHQMFRRLAERVRLNIEAFLDHETDADKFARYLSHYGGILVGNLHGHHGWEDYSYFPELSAADPKFGAGLEVLEKDHVDLNFVLDSFTHTANRTIKLAKLDEAQAYEEAGELQGKSEMIEVFLKRHLSDEEELAVPIILHHRLRG